MNILLRQSVQSDMPFLREMLYESVYWRSIAKGNNPSFEEALADPDVNKALIDWGREGDVAIMAQVNSIPAGAAWYRFYTDDNFIRGYVQKTIPTLVTAVHRDYRRQGIGVKMLEWLVDHASKHNIPKVSLMVSKDNHAISLYRKCGFQEYADKGDALLMLHEIHA